MIYVVTVADLIIATVVIFTAATAMFMAGVSHARRRCRAEIEQIISRYGACMERERRLLKQTDDWHSVAYWRRRGRG